MASLNAVLAVESMGDEFFIRVNSIEDLIGISLFSCCENSNFIDLGEVIEGLFEVWPHCYSIFNIVPYLNLKVSEDALSLLVNLERID